MEFFIKGLRVPYQKINNNNPIEDYRTYKSLENIWLCKFVAPAGIEPASKV